MSRRLSLAKPHPGLRHYELLYGRSGEPPPDDPRKPNARFDTGAAVAAGTSGVGKTSASPHRPQYETRSVTPALTAGDRAREKYLAEALAAHANAPASERARAWALVRASHGTRRKHVVQAMEKARGLT